MNITLIAVFIVIACFPGYLFIRSYYSSSFSIKFTKIDFYHEVFFSLIPSLIIHAIAIHITKGIGYNLNFHEIFIQYEKSVASLLNYISLRGIVYYNLYVWTSAVIAGNLSRFLIKILGWDILFNLFRYPNSYYYLLSGEIKDIEYVNRKRRLERVVIMACRPSRKIKLKVVDVLVKVNNILILYRGRLTHYTLAADNKLDKIYLSTTYKAKFLDDCFQNHNFKRIPGAFFMIDGTDIVNINIEFYEILPPVPNQANTDNKFLN